MLIFIKNGSKTSFWKFLPYQWEKMGNFRPATKKVEECGNLSLLKVRHIFTTAEKKRFFSLNALNYNKSKAIIILSQPTI